jgi:hypothetical protein
MTPGKVEFEPIDLGTDVSWWEKYQPRATTINELTKRHGRSWWVLKTVENKTHRVSLIEAEAPCLYVFVCGWSLKMPLRKVRSLEKDEAALRRWESLPGTAERDAFYDEWSHGGDAWGNPP